MIESLYLHFPYCATLCNYCNFYKKVSSHQSYREFTHFLEGQWEKQYSFLQRTLKKDSSFFAPLKTIYIGGGTPSLWGREGAKYLATFLERRFPQYQKSVQEFTLEINPGHFGLQDLDAWRSIGVNRFSVGAQTFNSSLLKDLNRSHTREETLSLLKLLSSEKVSFSVDFMLGLPRSVFYKRDIIAELELLLSFSPNHLSQYILTVSPSYVHYKELPSEHWIADEYLSMVEYLEKNNLPLYEVSNFARRGFESLHNKKYWNLSSVLSLGPSATGLFRLDDEKLLRYKWGTTSSYTMEKEILEGEKKVLEELYLQLRQKKPFEYQGFRRFVPSQEKFDVLCTYFKNKKYLFFNSQEKVHYLTPKGFLLLDSLLDDFHSLEEGKI